MRPDGARRHTIVVLVENNEGVLSRIATLFSARGYVIESLSLSSTHDAAVARIVIGVRGDERVIEQVIKQLHKLVDVIKVGDLTDVPHVERELVMIRVQPLPSRVSDVERIAEKFSAR